MDNIARIGFTIIFLYIFSRFLQHYNLPMCDFIIVYAVVIILVLLTIIFQNKR